MSSWGEFIDNWLLLDDWPLLREQRQRDSKLIEDWRLLDELKQSDLARMRMLDPDFDVRGCKAKLDAIALELAAEQPTDQGPFVPPGWNIKMPPYTYASSTLVQAIEQRRKRLRLCDWTTSQEKSRANT